ncbi:hypothetical protein FA10DRAFT_116772 [Acaromyces ingoldii]|uniref:Uncharacterized protein n=1 Tax=Acaromyces ingoldii TaxID=215250 RepID=A0A316YS58_9BASI|nr:hypothetical protein FA10DRAFT_116772 [Acaromyces ingoldii]PWN90575.1 hypothetical protein FA10DRAFT_116772 [Acaromyces ingoldii]
MPPKRLARLSSRSPSPPLPSQQQQSRASPAAAGAAPAAKPCVTCARQITPRSKWARNWDEIRHCSATCRAWRSVLPLPRLSAVSLPASPLAQARAREDGNNGCEWTRFVTVDHGAGRAGAGVFAFDAWVEANSLMASREGRRTTLDDVTARLDDQLGADLPPGDARLAVPLLLRGGGDGGGGGGGDGSSSSSGSSSSMWETRKRETVRRAARRLVIFPFAHSALCTFLNAEQKRREDTDEESARQLRVLAKSFSLWQGNRRLVSLEDVSFAKGPIAVDQVSE